MRSRDLKSHFASVFVRSWPLSGRSAETAFDRSSHTSWLVRRFNMIGNISIAIIAIPRIAAIAVGPTDEPILFVPTLRVKKHV